MSWRLGRKLRVREKEIRFFSGPWLILWCKELGLILLRLFWTTSPQASGEGEEDGLEWNLRN
jgi:hypothetical protein